MYWVRMKSRSFAWHDITIHFPDWELGSTFPQSWPGGKKHTVNLVGCIPLSKWAVKCLFGSFFGVINHYKPCISGSCMSHVWLDPPLETRGMHIHPVTRSPLRSRSTAGHSCPVLRNLLWELGDLMNSKWWWTYSSQFIILTDSKKSYDEEIMFKHGI